MLLLYNLWMFPTATLLYQTQDSSSSPITLPVALLLFFAVALPFAGRFWGAIAKTVEAIPTYLDDRQKARNIKLMAEQNNVAQIERLYDQNNAQAEQISKNNELMFAMGESNVKLSQTNADLSATVVETQKGFAHQRELFNTDRETWKQEMQTMKDDFDKKYQVKTTINEELMLANSQLQEQVRTLTERNTQLEKHIEEIGGIVPPPSSTHLPIQSSTGETKT